MKALRIAIILGSTRPGRNGEAVAKWVHEIAKKRTDAEFELEQLRLVMAEVQMATVRNQVLLSMFTDFENFSVFKPDARHEKSVNEMFDQVIAWGGALKTLREK
jgi:NAD(P)H-dependent FMN reductase